jgi:hypothetical protein
LKISEVIIIPEAMRMEKLVFPLRQWNLISLEFVGKIAEEEEERERNMAGTRNFG